jgi:hypothetical protein
MEKEFVPYELALRMKQLGFDETCCGYYDHSIKELDTISSEVCERLCKHDTHIKAPLFQQAFRWFREKYSGYHGVSDTDFLFELTINGEFIRVTSTLKENRIFQENGSSYEEVELACLEKMIEIVEQKQQEQ